MILQIINSAEIRKHSFEPTSKIPGPKVHINQMQFKNLVASESRQLYIYDSKKLEHWLDIEELFIFRYINSIKLMLIGKYLPGIRNKHQYL